MTSINVEQIRKAFPIFNKRPDLIYLDSAASTLKPQTVIDGINEYYTDYSCNIHRSIHNLAEESTRIYESTRDTLQGYIGAKHREEIIFTKGTTESLNLLAHTYGLHFQKELQIKGLAITQMEHHSNIVPWQLLAERINCPIHIIPINQNGDIILEEYEKILKQGVQLVSIVAISNSLGTVNPVPELVKMARQYGAHICIDGAQWVAHEKINVQELDIDFLAFSGHKIFGPTGVGCLYGKKELLDLLPPFMGGGDMIDKVSFKKTSFNELPYKFEAGTPNIAGIFGFKKAIEFVQGLGLENIKQHEKKLTTYMENQLQTIENIKFIGTPKKRSSVISFIMDKIHSHDLASILNQYNIAIRTGHHCTQPLMDFYQIPSTSRASLSIYNNREDVDQFILALNKANQLFL